MAAYWVRFVRRLEVKGFGFLAADGQAAQCGGAHTSAASRIDEAMLVGTVVLLVVAALQFCMLVH